MMGRKTSYLEYTYYYGPDQRLMRTLDTTQLEEKIPMTITETLKNNLALADDLIIEITRQVLFTLGKLHRNSESEKHALRAIILAWVQRVEAAAAVDQAKTNEGETK